MKKLLPISFFLITLMVGCTAAYRTAQFKKAYGPTETVDRVVATTPAGEVSFYDDVQPILEHRCDVCHGCYDAPCQVKLTSFEGIERGGSKNLVYDGARLLRAKPTRMFIDGNTVTEWRELEFHPILNERSQTPKANLENSVMNLMLKLKKDNPQPTSELLPASFDIGLDKEALCTTAEDFDQYKEKYPLWGMPYALPGLTGKEHDTINAWIEQGAKVTPRPAPTEASLQTVRQWENFFNGITLKEQLASRYLYEHLFMAHINFDNLGKREFYRLVRSETPSGLPVIEINTDRPYDEPGVARFFYRLKPVLSTIVVKNHTVYRIDGSTMDRYRELFLQDDYNVTALPGYGPKIGSNPFKVFRQIPAKSRYKFLLDNAEFTIRGFIKGPVCRGQLALNVINDHFFVAFTDPDKDTVSHDTAFLNSVSGDLALPAAKESTLRVPALWYDLFVKQKKYLEAKEAYKTKLFPDNKGWDISYVWDGDGNNDNALLTVFRHFDSASVVKGFVGETPKTGWVIDYPLLERVHYLLVAGFNIYGNAGHQLATRLYMDYLRWEGENNFLSFLPKDQRESIRNDWYRGPKAEYQNQQKNPFLGLQRETGIAFTSGDPKKEFFSMMEKHVGFPITDYVSLDSCPEGDCAKTSTNPHEQKADNSFRMLANLKGKRIQVVPDVTFIHVVTGNSETDLAYTIVRNKALSNNSFLFDESRRRNVEDDTLTIVKGHLGSYPNAFCRVAIDDVDNFTSEFTKIKDQLSYYNFARKYGVRRTIPDFWLESDWHNRRYSKEKPVESGLFDLYRYSRIAEISEADFKW